MCGIAGIKFDSNERQADKVVLERMVSELSHRGPDGRGYHLGPGIALGHARLSIIDLAGGAQPIHNEDSSTWIAFNGEIFNYLELREELIRQGHRFYTNTDTEVIVHLYEQLGDQFVERLNGQFAFALWDSGKRKLVLARDRAGILPLYYARVSGGVVFASEVKALLVSGLVSAAADPDGMDELMTFWAPVAPRTVFRGVSQICPGEMVVVQGDHVVRKTYWRWHFPVVGHHRSDDSGELLLELGSLLQDATNLRLRADVPVGAYLSGGLDSSTLVALLRDGLTQGLQTFSIGFDDVGLDESKYQIAVADYFKTKHRQVRCTNADVARVFPATIWHTESPVLRTAPAPMQVLSGLVRQSNVKVVLTGEGADEVLGGYDIFKESKVRQFWARQPESAWRPALLKRLYPYLDLTSAQSAAYLREFFGIGIDNPEDWCFSHLPRWATTAQVKMFWSGDWAAQVTGSAIERLRASLPSDMAHWAPFNRAEYLEARTLLPSYLLSSQGDRMLMANSVEGRFPFLDHRLIEFANRLPPGLKMRVLREKYGLKQIMRNRLPETVLDRHKQPYRAPDAASFLAGPTPDYVNELLGKRLIGEYGYFDPDKVFRLVSKLRRSRVAAARDNMAFVGVLSTQIWHARFIAGLSIN